MPDPRIDPRTEDVTYGDRRISRPDASLPDWEVPDTAYRPIPIVWFTGAFFVGLAVLSALVVILSSAKLVLALSALTLAAIAAWTWQRGMKDAGTGWQVATLAMLAVQLAFVWLAASSLQ